MLWGVVGLSRHLYERGAERNCKAPNSCSSNRARGHGGDLNNAYDREAGAEKEALLPSPA